METKMVGGPVKSALLGARVRIDDGGVSGVDGISGRIYAYTRFLDGSEGYDVQYWHNGERRSVPCERREFEVLP